MRIRSCWGIIALLFGAMFSIPSIAQTTYDSLQVTFTVDLTVLSDLDDFDPTTQTPKIAGSFTGWQNGAIDLADQGSNIYSETIPFSSTNSGDTLQYKFILVDTAGVVYWEANFETTSNNREYVIGDAETDSGSDGIPNIDLNHLWNDWPLDFLDTPRPASAAPNPTHPEADVISLFSDVYADVPVDTWNTVWSNALFLEDDIDGNPVKRYRKLDFNGVETVNNQIDITGMTHLSLDVWTSNATTFRVKLVDFGGDGVFSPDADDTEGEIAFENLPLNEWVTLEIPINDFAGLEGKQNIAQLIFSAIPVFDSEVFIDNVFFANLPLPSVDVTFNVNLTPALMDSIYIPETDEVKLVGSFNSWDTGLPIDMVDLGNDEFSTTINLESETYPDTIFYKFILKRGGEVVWDEPEELLFDGSNNRMLVLNGDETDTNEDGTPDVDLPLVDFAYSLPLPFPLPPYEFGDIINYDGSFAGLDLGPVSGGYDGWFFETVNGPSTYEIVDDSQDGDGKAAKATINFDGSDDIWRAQIVNEPINPSEGDLYNVSFWMKSSEEGSVAEAFLGLPEEGSFQDVYTFFAELGTEWNNYEFQYFASDVDEDLGFRFGVKLNFEANSNDMIFLDNVQIEKIEAVFTPITFSVNTAIQQELGNFDKEEHIIGLVGSFNGWDTNSPIMMEAEPGDSVYSGTVEMLNVAVDDEVRYKFIMKDDSTGAFQWESPDPENPNTDGEFSDRVVFIDDVAGMVIPTDYFHDIDRGDLDADNYGISSLIDARNAVFGSHLAVQGIVTRITNNFVYVQDETAATTLFSRPFFSSLNSISFNEATKNGDIQVGDELKVAGITADFNGLHELINMHAWEVVSSDNPLPVAQIMDIDEYSNNGEEYESEVVRIEKVRILDPVDSLRAGFVYEIVNEEETQIGWMSIQGSFNSAWAFQPAPQGFFNIEAVVKEFFIPGLGENIYAVAIHNESDIEIIPDDFDAEFSINSLATLPTFNETVTINLDQLGDMPIQGMELSINFDPALVDVSLGDQTGTVLEGTALVTNTLEGQLNIAFATDGTPENDISTTGVFLNLNVEALAVGETEIVISDISINEMPSPDLFSFINIVPRLCGDVTGDVTVSPEDATLVLQHTVKLEGVFPLMELDSTAADVTGNGDISAFDASWILQKTVGLRDNLGCISLPLKEDQQPVSASWLLAETSESNSLVQLDLSKNEMEIYAIQMEVELTEGALFAGIKNLPKNWNLITNRSSDKTLISLYGVAPLELEVLDLEMDIRNTQSVPKIKANLVLNERVVPELNELVIGDVPSEFGLNQNYPNPFNPSTNISYTLPEKSDVELSIFNMLGQKVATLVNQSQDAGTYSINWNAGSVSSGVYIYQLRAGGNTFTKRMMLIK